MVKQKYALIYQLSSWTNQTPPKYVLVPETMNEVIKRFMSVEKNGDCKNPFYYEQRYPYPDISCVNANSIIKMWIKRYIAVLFLRQYTLNEYYSYSRNLEVPNPPQSLREKRIWVKELDVLKKYVTELLSDATCLKLMNMEALGSPNWFADNNKPKPEDLIENLKSQVHNSAEHKKANQSVDPKEIEKLNNSIKRILAYCFDYYGHLFKNVITDTEPHKSLFYGGRYEVSDKMAYADDQDMGYSNYDRIYAEIISKEFSQNFPSIFRVYYNTTFYSLAEKDIFAAVDNLRLDSERYSIVSVGVNLSFYESSGVICKGNGLWEYKGIPIIETAYTQIDAVNKSLFVMLNEDVPCIIHNDIDESIKGRYGLKTIDGYYHIYTNVIDLNKRADIKEEVKEKTKLQDLDKSVLVCVELNTEVRCKIDAKCIQLKEFSQFDNIGNPSNPKDVVNIWN